MQTTVLLKWPAALLLLSVLLGARSTQAVSSSELYQTQSYRYGRFEARIQFGAGDGVISSFFLWKPGSETQGTFWNELDFEKLGADCHVQTNALYGSPRIDTGHQESLGMDACSSYHTYAFEWSPDSIAWLMDGVELRRDTGEVAAAFADKAPDGMQMHFNLWPGDATFGGNFDPAILPVQQYIKWVQYSAWSNAGFQLQWREEFDGSRPPSGWATGSWASPLGYSTHAAVNVGAVDGTLVLSLTQDDAQGFSGTPPQDSALSPYPSGSNSAAVPAAVASASGQPAAPTAAASSGAGVLVNSTDMPTADSPQCGCRIVAPSGAASAPRLELLSAGLLAGAAFWRWLRRSSVEA